MVVLLPARVNSLYQPHGGLVHAGLQALWMPALDYYPGITAQTVPDRSGNGNALTLGSTTGVDANDPSWSQQGLVFNGTSQYANIPNAALISGSNPLTIVVVFDLSVNQNSAILEWGTGSSDATAGIYYNANPTLQYMTLSFDNFEKARLTLPVTVPGRWMCAVGRFASGVVTMAVPSHTTDTATQSWTTANMIASTGYVGNDFAGEYFGGTIAAAGLYNRALSSAEMYRDYYWLRNQLAPAGVTLP